MAPANRNKLNIQQNILAADGPALFFLYSPICGLYALTGMKYSE